MQNPLRLLVGVALLAATTIPSVALAQAPATQVIGGTTITLGGGVQFLSLCRTVNFTFKTNEEGTAVHRQTNGTLDNAGGAFVGSI